MWKCPKCSQKVDDAYEICWKCGTTVDGIEDPEFLQEGNWAKQGEGAESDVTPESLVTLTKCSLPGEAHAIRVRLESEGIPVFLFDEFTITMDWLLSNAIGGIKVQVPEPYLEKARHVLGIVEQEQENARNEETEEDIDEDEADDDEADDDEAAEGEAPSQEEGSMDMERHEGITDEDPKQ